MYMYLCMYAIIYIYMYTYTHVYMHTHTHIQMYIYTYVDMYIYAYVYIERVPSDSKAGCSFVIRIVLLASELRVELHEARSTCTAEV